MSKKKAPGKHAHPKGMRKPAKSTTAIDKSSEGFTDEERVAMKERAQELKAACADGLFFASVDKSDLQPTSHRPKMTQHYDEAGLTFVPNFVLPVPPDASGA